jgi:hypothetical protein
MVCVYTNAGVSIFGTYVHGGLLLILCSVLFFSKVLNGQLLVSRRAIVIVIKVQLLWLITLFLNPSPQFFLDRAPSFLMLSSSMLVFLVVYALLRSFNERVLFSFLFMAILFLLIGSALEVYTGFKAFSDDVRGVLYEGLFTYSSDGRDLTMHGKVRPKLFSQEPSHLAKILTYSICAFGVLAQRNRHKFLTILFFLIAYFLTRSPTIFFGVLLYGFISIYLIEVNHTNKMPILTVVSFSCFVILYIGFEEIAAYLPGDRAYAIANGLDSSAIIRIGAAMNIAFETIKEYPVTGFGMGGREFAQEILLSTYEKYPAIYMERFDNGVGYVGWGNAFFEIFVYGGIVISSLIMTYYLKLFKTLMGSAFLGGIIFFCIFVSDSGFTAPRVWFFYALILAVTALRTNALAGNIHS